MENKLNNIKHAYTTVKKGDKDIIVLDTDKVTQPAFQNDILEIQRNLNVDFDLSYEIMSDACEIIAEKTLDEDIKQTDSLFYEYLDFIADADATANVYTSTQLSYLSRNNEAEISELMKDESITSIAQACSIWYTRKVAEACEALKGYILAN